MAMFFGFKLPLIGDALKDVGSFIKSIRDDVYELLKNPVDFAANEIKGFLFDALGPGAGSKGWLLDFNKDGEITPADVDLVEDESKEELVFSS